MESTNKKINKIYTIILLALFCVLLAPSNAYAKDSCEDSIICINNTEYKMDAKQTSLYFLPKSLGGKGLCGNIVESDILNATTLPGGYLQIKKQIKQAGKNVSVEALLAPTPTKCARNNVETLTDEDGNIVTKYKFITCPISEPNSVGLPADVWTGSNAKIKTTYDIGSGLWKVTLGELDANDSSVESLNNVDIKLVSCVNNGGSNCTFGTGGIMNGGITLKAGSSGTDSRYRNYSYDGKVLTFYMVPGQEFYVQLNLATGMCAGVDVYHFQGSTSTVTNNFYKTSSICTDYLSGGNLAIKKSLVPECENETLSLAGFNKASYEQQLNAKINEAKQHINSIANSRDTITNLNEMCTFADNYNVLENIAAKNLADTRSYTRLLYNESETASENVYWNAICTEKITIAYDSPKVVQKIGMSFPYEVEISIERSCEPVLIRTPQRKERCGYSVECWGGPAKHTGEAGAGPNEQFDSCVNSCDGGKYSQNCIDSCYESVYGAINKNTTYGTLYDDYYVGKIAVSYNNGGVYEPSCEVGKKFAQTSLPVSSCYITTGNATAGSGHNSGNCSSIECTSEHGYVYTYLDGCNSNENTSGTSCYEVYTTSPKCIENMIHKTDEDHYEYFAINENNEVTNEIVDDAYVEREYQKLVALANSQLAQLEIDMQTFKNEVGSVKDNYSMSVKDSHTGEVTTYDKDQILFKYYDENQHKYLTVGEYKDANNGEDPTDGIYTVVDTGKTVQYDQTRTIKNVTVKKNYSLNLGEAYVSNKNTGDIKYNLTTNSQKEGYTFGGNVFYTNILSNGINSLRRWPYFTNENVFSDRDPSIDWNISVNMTFGTWHEMTHANGVNSINCFYGLNECTKPINPPDTCPCNSETDVCESSGTTYIFRAIDLNDVFPNDRSPRWNWSDDAYNYGSSTDKNGYLFNSPTALTENIEVKGNSIYNQSNQTVDSSGELDYEIILTNQNIKEIRNYNKTAGNYNDFSTMNCTYDANTKMSICKSNLLGSFSGATTNQYMEIVKRGIAGCNNEFNGECIDSYSMNGSTTGGQ